MRREDVVKICDLTGDEASEAAPVETVEFDLAHVAYEVDLREDQAEEFRDGLRRYLRRYAEAGRKRKPSKAAPVAALPRGEATRQRQQHAQFLQAVREWARGRGHSVSNYGQVPKGLIDAYNHEAEEAEVTPIEQAATDMRIPAFMAPAV